MTNAMVRLLSRFVELHKQLPEQEQDFILLASAQMVIDLTENNPIEAPFDPEKINTMFEVWCTRKNFSLERYKHPIKDIVSYKDSKTRRAWYAVRDLAQFIAEAQEKKIS